MSPDLTRQLDRNQLKVMGRVWSVDAVAKNASTSFYGNIVALAESPVKEGLLYAGTDDGLIQVTEDGGANWRKATNSAGVPEMTYVSRLTPSAHDADAVYAAFDNHKRGDFKPYLFKTTDRGRTWTAIAGDLPERGTVYALAEDPVDPDLLFAGTEFGLFFTLDGGGHWVQLSGGMPTIAVRDLAIQQRENDLVAATFGRGFYVLDDYPPLRSLTADALEKDFLSFAVAGVDVHPQPAPGHAGQGLPGRLLLHRPEPAVRRRLHLLPAGRDQDPAQGAAGRREGEGEEGRGHPLSRLGRAAQGGPRGGAGDPADRDRRGRQRRPPADRPGRRRLPSRRLGPALPAADPTKLEKVELSPWDTPPQGPLAAPGTYTVSFAKRVDGVTTPLGAPQTFEAGPLGNATLPAKDRAALLAFQQKTGRLQRAVLGAVRAADEAQTRIDYLKKALLDTPAADAKLRDDARAIEARLADLKTALSGDSTVAARNEPTPPAIVDRVQQIVLGHWATTSAATGDATATTTSRRPRSRRCSRSSARW